jgi:hypothetical protein
LAIEPMAEPPRRDFARETIHLLAICVKTNLLVSLPST